MGSFIRDILAGITLAGISALAVLIYRQLVAMYRFRPFHRIWTPFAKGPTLIIITGKQEGHTIKVSVNETQSAAAVQKLIGRRRIPTALVVSNYDSITLSDRNIISMGSSPANEATLALLDSLRERLNYSYTADKDLIVNGELFRSEYRNNILVKDYALVCKATNPLSPNHKFLVFAGNHGVGTEGGVLAFTSAMEIGEIAHAIGQSDFYAVIETTCDTRFQHPPTSINVIRCSILTSTIQTTIRTVSETREERIINLIREIGGDEDYLTHVKTVATLAVNIANTIQSKGTDIDIDAVYLGSMFHDIGRSIATGIDHGIKGVEILHQNRTKLTYDLALTSVTFEKIRDAVECHIVGGISKEWFRHANLGIPVKDYMPQYLESKIVALSDQLVHNRDSDASVLQEAPDLDLEVFKHMFRLTREIAQVTFGVNAGMSNK